MVAKDASTGGVDQRFSVAVHAMCVLTFRSPDLSNAVFVGDNISVNPLIVKRIIGSMVKAGLAEAVLGARGGYRLARPADQVTLWDIYFAVQGSGPFRKRHGMPESNCDEGRAIDRVVYDLYTDLDLVVETRLKQVTLAHILQCAMKGGRLQLA
ncbi:Rrf2 family transcriptional regulator [Pannonibacter sp.]|uniref:Rrf2 family transcriptional regulator n=1 Tax=Pannonibacter sp. TaxID=1906786 RepID=UPI003F721AFA